MSIFHMLSHMILCRQWYYRVLFGKYTYVLIKQSDKLGNTWCVFAKVDGVWYDVDPEKNGGIERPSGLPNRLVADYLILASRKSTKFLPLNKKQFVELWNV